MVELQKNYTKEEIQAIKEWFDIYKNKLPLTLKLSSVSFTNLPTSVDSLLSIAEKHYQNSIFSGQIRWLFLIKEKLEESIE